VGYPPQGASLRLPPKFPFWSAIITQSPNSAVVPISSGIYVDIQPPPGETWLIFLQAGLNDGFDLGYFACDGVARYRGVYYRSGGTYGYILTDFVVQAILTNNMYASIYAYNYSSAGTRTIYYIYSGFKLSKPLWIPKRINDSTPPFKRKPTQFSIHGAVRAIADRIVDIYDHSIGDYRQAIVLEEDVPLVVDPVTNFPVERYSAYIYVDEFVINILTPYINGQLDLVKSGWKKYEAILSLLVRR